MEPYIFILIINLILSYIANISYDKKYKLVSVLSISILVLVNVIFSGCRDFGIGIDTNVYIEAYFNAAADLQSLRTSWSVEGIDKGFLLLAYVSNLFSDDAQSLLVVTSLFIQVFFYLALWQYKKVCNISIFVATLLFCIIFYCHTLNLMRQFCAISLLAYAFSLYIQGNRKLYLLLQVLAFFFHSSSVVFVMVPTVLWLSTIKNIRKRNFYTLIILIGLIVMLSSFFYFLTYLGDISIVSDVYVDRYGGAGDYVRNTSTVSGGTGLGKLLEILYPLVFICWGFFKKAIDGKECYFLFVISLLTSLINLLGLEIQFLGRLSFYIGFIFFISLSKLLVSKHISIWIRFLIITIYLKDWYYLYVINKGGDILPYKSTILNIL